MEDGMLLELFDRSITFHRCFVRVTKSVTGALLLSQALFWQARAKQSDGWWFKTQADWKEETGLSRQELDTAKKACSKFLKCEVRGIPATSHYKVDLKALQTSLLETRKLECEKQANSDAGNSQTTNIDMTQDMTSNKGVSAIASQFAIFRDSWMNQYKEVWGIEYKGWKLAPGREGKAVKSILSCGDAKAMIALAKRAWAAPKTNQYWNCQRAKTIAGFANNIAEIEAELSDHNSHTFTPESNQIQESIQVRILK